MVPEVSPFTVALVAGAETVLAFDGWAVVPTYGVMRYEPTGPPLDGAVQLTVAELAPLATALTPAGCPGTGSAYITSTQ